MEHRLNMKVSREGKPVEKRAVLAFAYEYGYPICARDESSTVSDAIFPFNAFALAGSQHTRLWLRIAHSSVRKV
jgi:hypothetical protein